MNRHPSAYTLHRAGDSFALRTPEGGAAQVRYLFAARRWSAKDDAWILPADDTTAKAIARLGQLAKLEITPDARQLLDAADQAPELPSDFKFATPPRPYQLEAIKKGFASRHLALFMSVRTGKTKVIIDIARARWQMQQINALVIFAPKSVREVWQEEFEKHAPDVPVVVEFSGEKRPPHKHSALYVFIQSLEGVSGSKKQRDTTHIFLKQHDKVMMVCDESHKIKTPNTTRTKNILLFSKKAVYKYILTGTELDKGIQDLWSQFAFLSDSILGSPNFYTFRNRYCIMGGFNAKQIVGWQRVSEFEDKVRPHMFRAGREVIGVPDTIYTSRWVDPAPEQLALARKIADGEFEAVPVPEHIQQRELGEQTQLPSRFAPHLITLTRHLRTQQVAGGDLTPGISPTKMLDNGPKLMELKELLQEHKDDKVVIWARFTHEIEQISAMLNQEGVTHVTFMGNVDPSARVAARQAFQADKVDVFVGNVQTGGTGLALYSQDLTRQHVLIYYSNSFSYIDRVQSEARTIMAGQIYGTMVYDIYMRGLKIEKLIQKALATKKNLYDVVVQGLATPT